MHVQELKQIVIDAVDGMANDLIKVSRDIHARPELAFEEFQSVHVHGVQWAGNSSGSAWQSL